MGKIDPHFYNNNNKYPTHGSRMVTHMVLTPQGNTSVMVPQHPNQEKIMTTVEHFYASVEHSPT